MTAGLRQVLAVIAGVAVALGVVMVFEGVNSQIYPMPTPPAQTTAEAMKAWVATLPTQAFLVVLAGYAVGAFAGAAVAARLARAGAARAAGVVGAFLLVASLMNLVGLPHPVWFWVANLLLVLAGAWAGFKLAAGRAPQPLPTG